MEHSDPCILCEVTAKTIDHSGVDGIHQDCPDCGNFKFTGTALSCLPRIKRDFGYLPLKGWILEQNRSGVVPEISSDDLILISNRPIPRFVERVEKVLLEASHKNEALELGFDAHSKRMLNVSYSRNSEEFKLLLEYIKEQEYASPRGGLGHILWYLKPKGMIKLEELYGLSNQSGSNAFVAMWFNEDMDEAYQNGFKKGILTAGYDPIRIDKVDHINKIDDEIIASINSSRFVVADFTGHRGGVYFEAGYAFGKGIPIFWTCRKDHLAELHFDIRQYNCIDWETPEDLAVRLKNRIEAVLGLGPRI